MEKLPQISKYGIHISHFSIQSNPESAELVNFWSSPIQIHWIGLDYESSGLIQSIPYPGINYAWSLNFHLPYVYEKKIQRQ